MMPPYDYVNSVRFPIGLGTQTVRVTPVLLEGSWAKAARERLKQLSNLPENWNGYGSPTIHTDVIEHALSLLSELAKMGMPEPKIVPVSGGGIQFEWMQPMSEVEIEILPDKSIQYLVEDSKGAMLEDQVNKNGSYVEFAPIVDWFVNKRESIDDLRSYALTY